MKKIYVLILMLCTVAGFAQTRLISHKSHSGSAATFTTALESSLFDIAESNFGLPTKEMRFTVDSVILLPGNRAVVISSEKDVYKTHQKSAFNFKPGRDTLYNHPLLSQQHQKDSILHSLESYGRHNTPVLINYDNDRTKKNVVPVIPGSDNFPDKPMLVFALALLSGVLAFAMYLVYKTKSVSQTA
jgi:hypothetical protein